MDRNSVLVDELKSLIKKSEIEGCVVGVWLATQDEELQEVFTLLCGRKNINYTEALALVKKFQPDSPFKRTSFIAHMKGICTCLTA